MTSSQILAAMIELPPRETWTIVAPGVKQRGDELQAIYAKRGLKVRFFRWGFAPVVAIPFPASQSAPSVHQFMDAYRLSTGAAHP